MRPLGRLPVTLTLGERQYTDDFHIYPDVTGTLLSWKTARGLNILPECYPNPPSPMPSQVAATTTKEPLSDPCSNSSHPAINYEIRADYPEVFNGQIKTIEGKKFRIVPMEDAELFCVHTPRTIPFTYRDKLKAELELLQS